MSLDESPARQGFRRLQLLDELESRGGALIPLVELERLRAIERRVHECAERSAFEREWVTFILTGGGLYGEDG